MQLTFRTLRSIAAVAGLSMALGAVSFVFLPGCTKNLDGTINSNIPPTVQFVNIPPEGQRFSRNPVIYWTGRDVDGQVAFYRYHVATDDDLAGMAPLDYIATVDSASWKYLRVNPTAANPQTKDIVPMTADLDDPVRTFVVQYVFLQAFDEENLGSAVVYRLFSRNDNPPQTQIFTIPQSQLPFVNAETPGGIITGIKLSWTATDPIDYPSDPPPFDFRWKLFGPYTKTDSISLMADHIRNVYVTIEGDVLEVGDSVIICDTTFVGSNVVIECDTILVAVGEIDEQLPACGQFESFFSAESDDFIQSNLYRPVDSSYSVVTSSVWTRAVSDTIYDGYRNFVPAGPDTTVQLIFFFWCSSRDDALVEDLVPTYRSFPVLNPKYERDIAVIDFTTPFPIKTATYRTFGLAKTYWYNVIKRWNPDILFDTTRITAGPEMGNAPDYYAVGGVPPIRIAELLKHKVVILYNDHYQSSGFADVGGPVYKAIDAGVNVWLTMRAPLVGTNSGGSDNLVLTIPPTQYINYFGATEIPSTSWFCRAVGECASGTGRIEDFVGAISLAEPGWPSVALDTSRLISQFVWNPLGGGRPRNTATSRMGLPEVDWASRLTPGTEPLYLYKSAYGASHPEGFDFTFEGSPVAHRRNTGFYRTVHFNFTPMVMDTVTMQVVVDSVLTWLFDASLIAPTAKVRYPEAPNQMSLGEARRQYFERTYNEDPPEEILYPAHSRQ